MNIFMTGATGFIGKTIVKRLLSEGHTVTALLLPDDSDAGLEEVRIARGDITIPDTLLNKMNAHDAVIHLAGSVGYGLKMETCLKINRDGTFNVAREAIHSGIRRFIHFSSVSVYGRVPDVSIAEDFPLKKIGDPYGDTKIDAENILNRYVQQDKLDLTVVRPTVIYGPGDDKFLPKLMENLRSGKARIIGSGENSVDLIHISDVAEFVTLLLKDERSIGKVYNLTNPDNPTWKEMLEEIASVMGVRVPEKHLPYCVAFMLAGMMELVSYFTGRPPRLTRYAVRVIGRQYQYVTDRMQNELGFKPKRGLLEGIRECVRSCG